jgi:putative DNA primase/helicase
MERILQSYDKNTTGNKYIINKNIGTHPDTRTAHDKLVVPYRNFNGEITALQYINECGKKVFKKGSVLRGSFFKFESDSNQAMLCEGYATGYSLWGNMGCNVYVCGCASNMKCIISKLLKLLPNNEYFIAADNDRNKKVNVGLTTARWINERYGIRYIFPKFSDEEADASDFNDFYNLQKRNKPL